MANTFRKKKASKSFSEKPLIEANQDQISLVIGVFLLGISILLFIAFVSFLFTGQIDQDIIQSRNEPGFEFSGKKASNVLGLLGAYFSHWFIFKWFGLGAFALLPILFLSAFRLIFKEDLFKVNLNKFAIGSVFYSLFSSIFIGFFVRLFTPNGTFLEGGIGFKVNEFFNRFIGYGSILVILLVLFAWLVFFHGLTKIDDYILKKKPLENLEEEEGEESEPETLKATSSKKKKSNIKSTPELSLETVAPVVESIKPIKVEEPVEDKLELKIEEEAPSFVPEEDNNELLEEFGPFDPRLELSTYKFPSDNLLIDYPSNVGTKVGQEELEANKNKIVETMNNFSIGISSIKATIGPTVTLYEIVPEAGVRISKIKNLEDDIALNLAALGIRIIAPMPGKGTVGIEVPNKNPEMVSFKSVVNSDKFKNTKFELPVILGKTISNEIFVSDLAKMPHLLMAGATGQGKSVGLNVILASLLYKKHPAEVKFVLVDPKKVELSLFNKIERHFLATLPNSEEAIITDTKKVINTLNSLCIEMDDRYNLLKEAGVRNIREYNVKFTKRKLNPEKGHKFLPYIVLVVDELADLMMTAGKEVEQPIARLAQLARAIGIHLILATQRPSVNVITGLIKANFPARLSFRVTAKVDSRTILDTSGSEQLVGNGDMLLSMGSDMVRLQCPFVDTPEIDKICEYIGEQRAYSTAYILPEFEGDEDSSKADFNAKELDEKFEEAARLLVNHQQGSTSLIQRKMSLGYNRAGRIIDQLEGAGIVGQFEGSKAREVLIKDMVHLEEVLKSIRN